MVNYWKQFENTGKVEDYLSYRSLADEQKSSSAYDMADAGFMGDGGRAGGKLYAGVPVGDRNHIETDPYRGVR